MREKLWYCVGTGILLIILALVTIAIPMHLPHRLSFNAPKDSPRKHIADIKPPFRFTMRTITPNSELQSGVTIKCLHPRPERGTAIVHREVETGEDGVAKFEITKANLVTDRYYWFSMADPEFIGTSEVGISPIDEQFNYTFQVLPAKAFMLEVVDENGRGIPKAQIWIGSNYPGFYTSEHAESDLQGRASIRFARVPVKIAAVASEYASTFIQSVELPTDRPYMIKLDEGTKIVGRVIDDENKPLAGLKIRAEKDAPYHSTREFILGAVTDEDGNFVLNNASEGKWNIRAVGGVIQPYFIRPLEFAVRKNELVNLSEIIAERGFCVKGQYNTEYKIDLKRYGSKHLISVHMYRPRIPGWDLHTSEDGTFAVCGLPCSAEGDIEFVGIAGFFPIIELPDDSSFLRIYPYNRIRFDNVPPGVYDGFVVRFLLSGWVRGSVVDSSGSPLPNAKIVIYPRSLFRTDSNGQFAGAIAPLKNLTAIITDPTTKKTAFVRKPFSVKEGEIVEWKIVIDDLK